MAKEEGEEVWEEEEEVGAESISQVHPFQARTLIKSSKLLLNFLWIPISSKVIIPTSC